MEKENLQLIKVETNEKGEQLVSGRELYEFLDIKTPYKKWFDRMCEYGFEENKDFITVGQKCPIANGGYQEVTNHIIKISMAKEISMIQRNEKGKQARLYFIECEKKMLQFHVSKKELLLVNVINAKNELEIALALNKYENEYVRPLETNLYETTKKLEHKQEVIDTMVEDVKLKTQRQFLVEIIKMKPKHIKERWGMLYKAYEHNKHINLNARYEGYNLINSPKLKSKLEYIDKVANDIPFLYGLAVKLFESDFKDKLKKYMSAL